MATVGEESPTHLYGELIFLGLLTGIAPPSGTKGWATPSHLCACLDGQLIELVDLHTLGAAGLIRFEI